MAGPSVPMIGTLYINDGVAGFSEKFWLPQSSYTTAVINMNQLCAWRSTLLPDGYELVWARVSFADKARDAKAAIQAPMFPIAGPPPAAGDATKNYGKDNKTEDALLFRFETSDGKWANRELRGLPDVVVTDDELVPTVVVDPAPPGVIPALGTNPWEFYLGKYLGYLLNNTMRAVLVDKATATYNLFPWSNIVYRRTSTRKTGRSFNTARGRR